MLAFRFFIFDFKTKWEWYDLRISVYGDDKIHNLSNAIESEYYKKGCRKDLADQIKQLNPTTEFHSGYTIDMLKKELDRLENLKEGGEKNE